MLDHVLTISIEDRLWVTRCICGVEFQRTHIAPVHCFGIWQRHLDMEGDTRHHATISPVGGKK